MRSDKINLARHDVNQNVGGLHASARLDEDQKKAREEARLKSFRSVKPVAVSVNGKEVVRTSTVRPDCTLPLVIEPNGHELDLVEWSRSNRSLLDRYLDHHGAVLFRGFEVKSATHVERLGLSLCGDLLRDNGEHQRGSITDGVYTPVFYPSQQQLLWHNENSFNHRWPGRILFCCVEPAARGGETPVVDSRKVYEAIDPRVREKFLARGVMYVRNYGSGLGLDWRAVFNTDSRQDVEEKCKSEHMEFEWKSGDELRTSCVRPAVIRHPRTGELTWFNQAQHWHPWCLDEATRESAYKLFTVRDMPRNCYYGDGTLIEDREMDEVLKAYKELEVGFSWHRGDVMVLDNMLTAHGRNSFEGERKLLVTMGNMLTFADVDAIPA
jgi:alpha-ketoglutarate-dependent taurine dioxygenase